jgi:hypothetical protein
MLLLSKKAAKYACLNKPTAYQSFSPKTLACSTACKRQLDRRSVDLFPPYLKSLNHKSQGYFLFGYFDDIKKTKKTIYFNYFLSLRIFK